MHWDSKILINYLPKKRGHPSYKVRFQMHWDSKILINFPLKRGAHLIRPDVRCTEIVKYLLIISLNRGHPSYQARCQMDWDSKILINFPLKRGHPSYEVRFQMHWESKILINYLPQERPPLNLGNHLASVLTEGLLCYNVSNYSQICI
jgi:hypothetical protein